MSELETLRNQAMERNPTYAKMFEAAWVHGQITTRQLEDMFRQIVEAKD